MAERVIIETPTENDVKEAIRVLRDLQFKLTKHHARIHEDAAINNKDKRRALEGICGQCLNLRMSFDRIDGKDVVKLGDSKNRKGADPLTLYAGTDMFDTPTCHFFKDKKLEPSAQGDTIIQKGRLIPTDT